MQGLGLEIAKDAGVDPDHETDRCFTDTHIVVRVFPVQIERVLQCNGGVGNETRNSEVVLRG